MVNGLNSWSGVGVLERDPIVKWQEDESTPTVSFTVRVEEMGKDGGLFKVYVPVEAYSRLAEQAATLRAGELVGIEGKLKWRAYVDKDHQKKGTLAVWARQMSVLTG
jgi:single-stranded DNA-binding protein